MALGCIELGSCNIAGQQRCPGLMPPLAGTDMKAPWPTCGSRGKPPTPRLIYSVCASSLQARQTSSSLEAELGGATLRQHMHSRHTHQFARQCDVQRGCCCWLLLCCKRTGRAAAGQSLRQTAAELEKSTELEKRDKRQEGQCRTVSVDLYMLRNTFDDCVMLHAPSCSSLEWSMAAHHATASASSEPRTVVDGKARTCGTCRAAQAVVEGVGAIAWRAPKSALLQSAAAQAGA